MKKKTDEEYGVLITREMIDMMLNSNVSYENRAKIMCAIIGEETLEDNMMIAFASSLKTGYVKTNERRRKQIESRRKRQSKYQKDQRASTVDERQSTAMDVDERQSTEIDANERLSTVDISTVDERASTVDERASTAMDVDERASPTKLNYIKLDYNIPLNPPTGVEGDLPPAVSAEDLMDTDTAKSKALELAAKIVETEAFAHMRVNRGKLMKCLCSILKKNSGAEDETGKRILDGIAEWTKKWEDAHWEYAPGRITDFLYDEKWMEIPATKKVEYSYGCDVHSEDIA